MVTVVQKTIGTASRDYTTPALWEAASPADLVASDQVWEGILYKEGAGTNNEWTLSSQLVIGGSTTDSTRFKRLTCAAGQSWRENGSPVGRYLPSKGVAIRSTGSYGDALPISITEQYTELVGLQFQSNGVTSFRGYDNITVDSCILAIGTYSSSTSVWTNNSAATMVVKNSLLLNSLGCSANVADSVDFINCTFFGDGSGNLTVGVYGGTVRFKNCAIANMAAEGTGVSSGSSYNGTDFASLTGSNNQTSLTLANMFVVPTLFAGDYRLKSGSPLIDIGTSSGAPAVDAFGTARPQGAAYDVGFHEFVSAGGGLFVNPLSGRGGAAARPLRY